MRLLRMPSVPVPTYTISGFDSDTRIAPMEGVWKNPSETFCQLSPALVVFQTPPPDAPMKKVSGWSLTPATAVTRPPRLGPRERKWSSRKRSCGTVSPPPTPRSGEDPHASPHGGVRDSATWYESVKGPNLLRIGLGDPSAGRGVVYTAESSFVFRDGKLASSSADGNPFLPLIMGVYLQPVEETERQLAHHGVDVSKAY